MNSNKIKKLEKIHQNVSCLETFCTTVRTKSIYIIGNHTFFIKEVRTQRLEIESPCKMLGLVVTSLCCLLAIIRLNSPFQIITPFRRLMLCAENRKEMEDWISSLKSVQTREPYEVK